MNTSLLPVYEVNMLVCGMNARMHVRASSRADAIALAHEYMVSAGMDPRRTNLDVASASEINIIDVEAVAANENRVSAKHHAPTVVDYNIDTGLFDVKCGGEFIECFANRREAEGFALEHDQLDLSQTPDQAGKLDGRA
jgi:hypothetical protein